MHRPALQFSTSPSSIGNGGTAMTSRRLRSARIGCHQAAWNRSRWVIAIGLGLAIGVHTPATSRAEEGARTETMLREALAADDHQRVVELSTTALQVENAAPTLWYWRARANFCLGKIEDAVRDFDRYRELQPERKSQQWERGIALYYAGKFEQGAAQFELYQTYHDNDVENSVWRFLCLAPTVGLDKARETMLPIRRDPRVPMMPIYDLYRGAGTIEQVWEAVAAGDPMPAELAGRRFYAQLYVGLYHEARGEAELARKYLLQAADEHEKTERINRYMWQVARVHADRIRPSVPNAK